MQHDSTILRERADGAGQGHVFAFWDRLDGAERTRLLAQVARLDFDLVERLGGLLRENASAHASALTPPKTFPLDRSPAEQVRAEGAREVGARRLADGEVGYVLVAGGQASRLGYDGPKGCFSVGPVSGRSLFDMHARRLLAAQRRHGQDPVWYVMTSEANDRTTREFFAAHGHFGLDPANVFFFGQAMLPALDDSGRILLTSTSELFLAPNGHGGVLDGLMRSGALADAHRRGIRTLSYFQVDNPLARPADTLFLGLHTLENASMSSKVVDKRSPGEKVGVLGYVDGKMGCIEYSDLSAELREAKSSDGKLLFRAGNIAVHAIEREFIEELTRGGLQLPYHLARKKLRALDGRGEPCEQSGTKFETFVFDALARSPRSVVLEVERAVEFSPVKNASGDDSPATACADLCRLFAGFADAAGLPLPAAGEDGCVRVEVDPVLAEDRAEFAAAMPLEPRVTAAGHLYSAAVVAPRARS